MTFPTYVHLGQSLPSQDVSSFCHAGGFLKGNYSPDVVTTGLALSPLELHLNGTTWDVCCLCLASFAQHCVCKASPYCPVSQELFFFCFCFYYYIYIPLHILRPNRDMGASTLNPLGPGFSWMNGLEKFSCFAPALGTSSHPSIKAKPASWNQACVQIAHLPLLSKVTLGKPLTLHFLPSSGKRTYNYRMTVWHCCEDERTRSISLVLRNSRCLLSASYFYYGLDHQTLPHSCLYLGSLPIHSYLLPAQASISPTF